MADPPTEPVDYGTLNAVYALLLAAIAVAARERAAKDDPIELPELVPIGLATFALAKSVARERIGTWVREPFVDESTNGGAPKGRRLRHAIGELVTCTRCMGAWSALAVVGLRLTAPRAGRTVTSVLAAAALNDWLQSGFRLLCERTNVETQQAQSTPAPIPGAPA